MESETVSYKINILIQLPLSLNQTFQEFSGRGVTCAPGQEFSAFGFISFLLIGINLSANIINNLNANSNDNNNNNNNNNDNNNNNNNVRK